MNKYHVRPLPNWVLTNLQSAFYDSESGTVLQQMARVYSKIEELIATYNEFVCEINRYIKEFEDGIIKDFECFKNCIIKTMNDYIETIDMKINLQDLKISEAIERQDNTIAEKFNSQDEIIQNAVDYMKNNLVSTLTVLFNQALENGDIHVNLVTTYREDTESLTLSLVAESEED